MAKNKLSNLVVSDCLYIPDLLILGVQKSATTALFDSLKEMDGFVPAVKKEIHFFDSDSNYSKGFDWYASHFHKEKRGLSFEATPSYIYSANAAQRIGKSMVGKKFVLMLRDPVKRCLSSWNMFRRFNANPVTANYIYDNFVMHCNTDSSAGLSDLLFAKKFPSFEQCIDADLQRWSAGVTVEEPSFVRRGLYYDQIENYLKYFNLSDFLVVEQEDYQIRPSKIIDEICIFLGVNAKANENANAIKSNIGDYADITIGDIKPALLHLYEIYQEHNKKLFSLLGREFAWGPAWLQK